MPFSKRPTTSLVFLLTCALAALPSCVSDSFSPNPDVITGGPSCNLRVTVGLDSSSLAPDETAHAVSTVTSMDGTVVGGTVKWSSDNTAVATVSPSGEVTAVETGTAGIQAAISSCIGRTSLSVRKRPTIAAITVSVDSVTLAVGHSAQAHAAAQDSAGNPITVKKVQWASRNPNVSTVSSTGLVTAVAAGTTMVQATIAGDSGMTAIAVTDPSVPPPPPPPPPPAVASVTVSIDSSTLLVGHTAHSFATARDASGTALTGLPVTWTSTSPSIASISTGGVITGITAGTAVFQATVRGVSGSASLPITAPPPPPPPPPTVATVSVSIDSTTLLVGHTAQATATAKDAAGTVITGLPVTWTSANPIFATISASGVITAVAPGTASIRATIGGVVGNWSLTVTAPPPTCASIAVNIDSASLVVGHLAQAFAAPKDASGNPVNGLTIMWTSLSPTIASVSASGRITALAVGIAVIQASSGACSGTKSVSVVAPPPAGAVSVVSVATDSTSLAIGHQAQASAVAKDASGNTVSGQTVTWSSLTPSILSVSSTGLVQALASGAGKIQASVSGVAGVKSLDVVAPPDLASHNFNDGTYGVFQEEDADGSVSVVDDPTGAGRGKVVRIHYAGTNQDRNRNVYWDYPTGIGLGKTLYSRFRVYHPSPFNPNTFIGRKYIYWQEGSPSLSLPFGQPFWTVIGLNGTELAVDLGRFNQGGSVAQTVSNNIFPGNIKADTWYTIETQMTVNTSPSSNDGIFRLWINGALIYEKTNWRWTDPAWAVSGVPVNFANFAFHWFFVGEQTSYTQGSFDELRYIDDLAFSTKRIGQ